jgi:chromosome segregation ATPase
VWRLLVTSSLLFCLSSPLFSDVTYQITEAELSELETILERQAATIERQEKTLIQLGDTISRQDATLSLLSTTIERQRTTINALETSFNEYAIATRRRIWTTAAISVGVGFIVGVVVVTVF